MQHRRHSPREKIWGTVSRIPRGMVTTYATVARLSGFPGQARLVGYTLHALPPGLGIPWQRVVNAAGRVSLKGKAGRSQRLLLEKEGIIFTKGRIDLNRFGWPANTVRFLGRKRTL